MQKSTWQEEYMQRYYRSKPGWIDGTKQFFDMIGRIVPADAEVLELGPGPTNACSDFLHRTFAAVDGLDIDEDIKNNPSLRECFVFDGGKWPIQDGKYDAIVSNYVFEHVGDVRGMASEALRVLKPGGLILFRTPNLWHYVSMVSRLTPHWFHEMVSNRIRNLPSDSHDPYPTYYRLNTRRACREVFSKADFEEVEIITIEKDPSYGMSSKLLFVSFMCYERIVNASEFFAPFRVNILGAFKKPR